MKPRQQPHHIKYTVRICSFISSIYKTLFVKARKQITFTNILIYQIMAKKLIDETHYKVCKCEKIFAFKKDPKTGKIQIVVGNNLVSRKEFDTFEQAEKFVSSKPYELIINTACLFMYLQQEQQKEQNNND